MLKLKSLRDKEGVVCRHCGSKDHHWKSDKCQYECKHCKTRTTLRSGTVMLGSQLPLSYCFVAMHLLTSSKKSFSAIELQRQLGHKYYEPIWTMLHKLRLAMGKRVSQYILSGQIELYRYELHKSRLNLAHIFSAGLSSGEYGGRKINITLSGITNAFALWKAPLSNMITFNSSGSSLENSFKKISYWY